MQDGMYVICCAENLAVKLYSGWNLIDKIRINDGSPHIDPGWPQAEPKQWGLGRVFTTGHRPAVHS